MNSTLWRSICSEIETCQTDANLQEINPRGYVPALELDNGEIITETPAVLQRIANLDPSKQLAPDWQDQSARIELIGWLGYIGTELHKTCSPIILLKLTDEQRAQCIERLNVRLAYMNDLLAEQNFVMGEQFSVADCYLFVVLGWDRFVGFDISPYANLVSYKQRVAARESVTTYMQQIEPYMPKK